MTRTRVSLPEFNKQVPKVGFTVGFLAVNWNRCL